MLFDVFMLFEFVSVHAY